MKFIKKILKKLKILFFNTTHKSLPYIEKIAYYPFFNQPFTKVPTSNIETYEQLSIKAKENTYTVKDVELIENKNGFAINKNWISDLAFHTQVVIKKSELNYAHGRILYSVLRNYLEKNPEKNKAINIVETGTARGFSSLCMAKALFDSNFKGTIYTFDVLPHETKMFWNCVSDYKKGMQSRKDLLNKWSELVENYIIFIQGFTRLTLPKFSFSRINFAFLDGAHSYNDVLFEFNLIEKYQKKGDIIVFDDYNIRDFPGIAKAIDHIASEKKYLVEIVRNKRTLRDYAIAEKIIPDK